MSDATLFDILKTPAALMRLTPLRIILKKDETGKYLGYCENSFSMSWEHNYVQIHWSGPAYSNFGTTHQLDAREARGPAGEDYELLDPLAEDCPIEIDWDRWLAATTKYEKRNARFKLKEKTNE